MNNCFVFALSRWFSRGGYLIVRKSRVGWFPHFIWAKTLDGIVVEHWQPLEKDVAKPLNIFVFKGKIKTDDKE